MTHSYVWHDSFTCVIWLIHMCAMTHSYVCHDSFTCVPWLIHMCIVDYSCDRQGPRTRLCYMCAMTHSCVHRDLLMWMSHVAYNKGEFVRLGDHMSESRHTYEWVMAQIWMSHGTHTNESHITKASSCALAMVSESTRYICVCVWERETERARERYRKRECVCMCVYVCVCARVCVCVNVFVCVYA